RGRLRPTVAAPRTWAELGRADLHQLDYQEVMKRVAAGKDPFAVISGASGGGDRPPSDGGDGGNTDPRLEKYRAKRDAAATPEPFTAEQHQSRNGEGSLRESFVIQEHHASRLHYDFRLERDGVLVSWALPKGVPTSKAKNHLAVQTEDHPMDYADFEGTIPTGQYGAGTVSIWDRGHYECEKWIAGKEVIATLTGQDDGGLGGTRRFALIHTGQANDQWLIHLMDSRDAGHAGTGHPADADARHAATGDEGRAPRPAELSPMLASPGTRADLTDDDWQFELKWDGVRALVLGDAQRIRLISRNGIDMSASYPELTDRSCWPPRDFAADGEIIAVGPSGRPDFGLLQGRMKLTKAADVAKARAATPVRLMLFDLLTDDGEDLRRRPLTARRRRLEEFIAAGDLERCPVELSQVIDADVGHLLESAEELGLEGVMAKRTGGRYVGQRSRSWLKLKFERTQEVVVGGWLPGNGGRRDSVGSLLVGIPDGARLRYVGRVGSGFSTRELAEIRRQLDALPRKTSPFDDVPAADAADAHWVSAKLVGEVTFGEWTGSGKLRHPVWRGWRLDKTPADVVVESGA
ncbi:MAG TPA: non-homologous end-joining DNA ligase, partial [Arthrobacter sp.]|nr:non-homologous end-joining DNA ligase [Arthrobacter sp.]